MHQFRTIYNITMKESVDFMQPGNKSHRYKETPPVVYVSLSETYTPYEVIQ